MKQYAGLVLLILFVAGCATVDVSYDFDQQFNFAGLRHTIGFPSPKKRRGMN